MTEDKAKSIIHSKTLLDFKRKRNYVRSLGFSIALEDEKKKKSQMDVESDLFYCFVSTSFGGVVPLNRAGCRTGKRETIETLIENYGFVTYKGSSEMSWFFFLPVERFTFPPEEKEKRKKRKVIRRSCKNKTGGPRAAAIPQSSIPPSLPVCSAIACTELNRARLLRARPFLVLR